MSTNDLQTPDLASILRILAASTPQNSQQQTQLHPQPPQITPEAAQIDQHHQQNQLQQQPWYPQTYTGQASTPNSVPAQKLIDPASITEWSSGLRCMIKVQHDHEEQWWKGREALVEKQKAREEGQKKLDAVLKAVGGSVTPGASNVSPEELARELETFDMKVYKAQMQMVREMTSRLRSHGVPFFGTKVELIRVTRKEVMDSTKDEKGMIDEEELVKLQRKMLSLLEDLCED
ncbi:hypothetical protein B7494_g1111 [Chlorociboria aeruginascens]|nr:hypothetical protein B7494_g1111 [Chlorociboria aeruginascens]